MRIPPAVEKIISMLEDAGFEAYAVGGCVRDSLLGKAPQDWDICTSALPEQTLRCFESYATLQVGKKHGTITVLLQDVPYEITTYRVEGRYSDARRPDSVAYVRDLKQDLLRRDFTINAMAYHPSRGLVDYFGGQADLQNGLVRCVGNAYARFSEDALRILRALRFAACLGFEIQPQTGKAAHALKDNLLRIAPERIRNELNRILCGQAVLDILLKHADILCVFLPELRPAIGFDAHLAHHCYDVYGHIAHSVHNAPPQLILRLTMLLHDIGKPQSFTLSADGQGNFKGHADLGAEMARTILERLRYDTRTIQSVCSLVRMHSTLIAPEEPAVRRALNRLGPQGLRQLFCVQQADIRALSPDAQGPKLKTLRETEDLLQTVLSQPPAWKLEHLAIGGRDILALGVLPGKQVGHILQTLLEHVMDGDTANTREALLHRAQDLIKVCTQTSMASGMASSALSSSDTDAKNKFINSSGVSRKP